MKRKDYTRQLGASSRTAWRWWKADQRPVRHKEASTMPRYGVLDRLANLKISIRRPIRLRKVLFQLPLPRRTVRLRLTLLYSSLFLASGVGLLAITYVLVAQQITGLFSLHVSGGTPP